MFITFSDICHLLQSVENISKRRPPLDPAQEKESCQRVISNWFQNHRQALDSPGTNGGAVLSALFPHRRKDRVYGLQAASLSTKLTKLLNFNRSQRASFDDWATGTLGDLGVYVEKAMRPWDGTFATKSLIPIERIDQLLVQLAAKCRFTDKATRSQRDSQINTDLQLRQILVILESWEAQWLIRLILRDYCTIELSESFVFRQYHFLLPDLLMFQNDFDAVFNMLKGELSCYPPVPGSAEIKMRIEVARKLRAVVGVKVGRPNLFKARSFQHCFQLVEKHSWAAEVKYDGEYCEVHVDLESALQHIKIFSKNGKDATADRRPLHSTIRDALRIGSPDCLFNRNCVVLGEMVVYSDKEKRILPFSKIRKHVSRSGRFLGTDQDSFPHKWEHLMIIFFDVLVLDDEPTLRRGLQDRRKILRELVQVIPGRSMRSEWTMLDFKTRNGMTDLKQTFARTLAKCQEGLVLKPLQAPYFPLHSDMGHRQPGFFIKVKKDYLADMGGERDLGDFAIIGASFDPQSAPKSHVRPLHWTHFHIGCLKNRAAVQRAGQKPKFKVVAILSLEHSIPKADLKYLNTQGYVRQVRLNRDGSTDNFDIEHLNGFGQRMPAVFKKPFVTEILGSSFEKLPNEEFEMLRHPRINKIHHDRTWEDTVTMDELKNMADEKWEVGAADTLDGHARDVVLLVNKYANQISGSQTSVSQCTPVRTTTPYSDPRSVQNPIHQTPSDTTTQESWQSVGISSTVSPIQCPSSAQGAGDQASRPTRILVREDTCERLSASLPPPISSLDMKSFTSSKGKLAEVLISPPPTKRRRVRTPLKAGGSNQNLGAIDYDSQDKTIHIYADKGLNVQVHAYCEKAD